MSVRVLLLPVMLAVLTACGEARTAPEARARDAPPRVSDFYAFSESARTVTGNVSIEPQTLSFASGQTADTITLESPHATERVAPSGMTFADAALSSSSLRIDLRRIVRRVGALCEGAQPGYVALAYGPRATRVTLLMFSGPEPPGPHARRSRLCASYVYVAPDGARTRPGLVLQ